MAIDLTHKRVMVTGGAGFLGRCVVRKLEERGCADVFVPRSFEFDLTRQADVARALAVFEPDVVIHLAAMVGGIGANLDEPGRFFYENAMMGIELIEQSRRAGVEKFVCLGSVCMYPRETPVPFAEDAVWDGLPEEINAPYGIAKKTLLMQLKAYRAQYGMSGIFLMPGNLYGPGDNFDLRTGHVIPALVRRFIEARDAGVESVTLWGSGDATREFLFVEDAAEAILRATERYDSPEPVNLGTGVEVSIREVAADVARLVGYTGAIGWDTSRPDGQPRRCLDTTRAEAGFGFRATTSLEDGLRSTIEWYERGGASVEAAATPPAPYLEPVEEIYDGDELIAIIMRGSLRTAGVSFYSPNHFSQQLGFIHHGAGHRIVPHVHNPVPREVMYTQETLFVREGRLRVDLFSDSREYLTSRVLSGGDAILLSTGGHGFEILDESSLIEVKQGPYAGEGDKTRFDGGHGHVHE